MSSTTTTTSSDIYSKLKSFGMLFAGALILGLHVGLYYLNVHVFNIFVCLYILLFAILVLVILYQDKACFANQPKRFNFLTYLAFYTIFIEVIMVFVSIIFMSYQSRRY
jgi:hypothetical protein